MKMIFSDKKSLIDKKQGATSRAINILCGITGWNLYVPVQGWFHSLSTMQNSTPLKHVNPYHYWKWGGRDTFTRFQVRANSMFIFYTQSRFNPKEEVTEMCSSPIKGSWFVQGVDGIVFGGLFSGVM